MKKFANVYCDSKYIFNNHTINIFKLPDNKLFQFCKNGVLRKTNIGIEDLPENYIPIYARGRTKFINVKAITDIKYAPLPFPENHILKDDFLFISFDEKIEINENEKDEYRIDKYKKYDTFVFGNGIIQILNGLDKYTNFDISFYKEEIWNKIENLRTEMAEFVNAMVPTRQSFEKWFEK